MSTTRRLPSVPSLSKFLAPGTEGGKEFARIMNLLLLQNSKNRDLEFNLFDDASGDYEGLDGFSRKRKSKDVTGYQYKFFPSPLSDQHRSEIKKSIEHALNNSKRLKLENWILVTPDDFKNSARRKNGGDVDWFESLRETYKKRIDIEHIGHTEILSLFLQAEYLCLLYYPSLVPSGASRKKGILELRTQYDKSMRTKYGRVEFVGMSVYKEETSRRIPLEDIYIPLTVIPERAPEETDDTPRINPAEFLKPKARTIILGDPGSGKSTLLSFLALIGTNEQLQIRHTLQSDERLTIVVTLRRYVDELKSRRNLSILEFIVDVARADFNLSAIDISFYEFYLETGQAIVLFDGLDELPTAGYKSIIRDRIESFSDAYPVSSIIVTSRLVGYEAEVRFGEAYSHYRVAKLRIKDINKFINDWYAARIEDPSEKTRNIDDLVQVISNPESESIRTLARNPLLLTIVALVHRIDAVLPDQRVVLYQKCTETLLNTWHKAKHRDVEPIKGRIERHNRLRVEAIAFWMHKRSIKSKQRSVAKQSELLTFLTNYISENEKLRESDEQAEDQAEKFIEFIKTSAGLLIEAGDGLYSFIHLTFQEYLCATHLAARAEVGGTQTILDELGSELTNPRWREVVRLLVASLKSIQGQTFFVEKLIDEKGVINKRDTSLLLLGLLRDGIEPAEINAHDIVRNTYRITLEIAEYDDIQLLESALSNWMLKDERNPIICTQVWDEIFKKAKSESLLILVLIRIALKLPKLSDDQEKHLIKQSKGLEQLAIQNLLFDKHSSNTEHNWTEVLDLLHLNWAMESPVSNAAAALGFCISISLDNTRVPKRLLEREMTLLHEIGHGPHSDNGTNMLALAMHSIELHPAFKRALTNALNLRYNKKQKTFEKRFGTFIEDLLDAQNTSTRMTPLRRPKRHIMDILELKTKEFKFPKSLLTPRKAGRDLREDKELSLMRSTLLGNLDMGQKSFGEMLLTSEIFSNLLMESLNFCLNLHPKAHWNHALKISLKDILSKEIGKYFDVSTWSQLTKRLKKKTVDIEDLDFAAWIILFDIWVWNWSGYEKPESSPAFEIIAAAQKSNDIVIKFALIARDICTDSNINNIDLNQIDLSSTNRLTELLRQLGWKID